MGRIALLAQCTPANTLNFDYDPYNEQVPINLENFGYNTYSLYNKAVSAENTNSANDHYTNCTDQYNPKTQFMDIWDELPGNMMRFPGGTASQLYHSGFTNYSYVVTPALSAPYYPLATACPYASYSIGSTQLNSSNNKFKGYGVKSKTGIGGEKLPENKDLGNAPQYPSSIWDYLHKEFDPHRKRNIIYDFIELIKEKEDRQGGKKVEVLFVFNIMTHLYDHSINANLGNKILDLKAVKLDATAPKHDQFVSEMNENLNTLRFLLNNGINVVGVEMGNELTHDRYAELELSPIEYIEIVKQYAEILRTQTEFNGIKIGVVGEVSLADDADLTTIDCNEDILQNGNGILQLSTTYNLCWDIQLAKNSKFLDGNKTIQSLYDAFIIHKYFNTNHSDIYNINNDKSFGSFMNNIEDIKTIYLNFTQNNISNFKIWFTEWNQDPIRIDDNKKSDNTRYIYDVYSYLTQYNAFNNNVFEYTTFHNFLGASKISLIYTNGSGALEERDNIKAHYLMNKIQDIGATTSYLTSNTTIPKSSSTNYKFTELNVSGDKFWLKDYAYLAKYSSSGGFEPLPAVSGPCGTICRGGYTLYKIVYFMFNNSTNNSYCLNPTFKNENTFYTINPNILLGNTVNPSVYYYNEDFSVVPPANDKEIGFMPAVVSANSSIIQPKSIGYVRYAYPFDPVGCYPGYRLANMEDIKDKTNPIFIYPNPAQNKLFVGGVNIETSASTTIYDAQGKAQNYKLINNEIDISNLTNGIYFLSLENEGILFHQKFVIQK